MRKFLLLIITVSFSAIFAETACAQKVAIKTNLLYDATTTINLGMEFRIAEKWTMDISGNYNPWTFANNMKWKHWLVQPEFRYWTCRRFGGNFFAAHLLGAQYNVGNIPGLPDFLGTNFSSLSDHRYEGYMIGAGIAYGYAFMLSEHWNLELEIGLGYIYSWYDIYQCPRCGELLGSNDHHYFGPTKAAINLVFLF